MDIIPNMKIYKLILLPFALLFVPGCQTPPPEAPLILTCEDLALKRKPFLPCWSEGHSVRVDYGK